MDRTIARHLAKRGMAPTKPPRENLTFSDRNPDFFKWFHESVMGFDSEEYRREFWREARRTGHTIGHVPYGLKEYHRRRDTRLEGAAIVLELLVGGSALAVWLVRKVIDRHIQRLRRPTYYETERARRLGLAEERRRIRRRRTLNAMPGREELLEAFRRAKDSPADMVRFGSLIEDLECYVDNTPYFRDGRLVGRRGGIRRHLEREVPELYARYKTVMRYKALSKRFRQATGISDPVPAASLLPEENENERCREDENSIRNEILRGGRGGVERCGAVEKDAKVKKDAENGSDAKDGAVEEMAVNDIPAMKIHAAEILTTKNLPMANLTTEIMAKEIFAKEILTKGMLAKEILEACEGSVVSLAAQLELRINPNYTPPIRTVRISGEPSQIRTSRRASSNCSVKSPLQSMSL